MKVTKIKLFLLSLFSLSIALTVNAGDRNYLSNLTTGISLRGQLLSGTDWIRFPNYTDRDGWNRISKEHKLAIITNGEEAMNFEWGIVKATDFLEFVRSGDRNIMQNPYFNRQDALQDLVLAELVEGEGRFMDQIINGIWALSEQTTWGLSAHMYLQQAGYGLPDIEEPVIDLFGGELSSLFSWAHYFLKNEFDKVDTLISKRIRYEIRKRILDVYYQRDDFWWMSFGDTHINNWNVWVNHNMLTTILLMEDDPEVKAKYVYKTMRSVDKFINFYKPDGGCDEGPSYWGHAGGAMFEYLELLKNATGGGIDIFDKEIIKNIGKYIYRANIAYPYMINFADASSIGGGRPGVIYRFGKSIGDPVMQSYGAFLAEKSNWMDKLPGGNLESMLTDLFMVQEITNAEPKEPLIPEFYLPDLQICGARDKDGSREGFFFAAKGGHNQENHNHNDVGNFILYYNGQPAIIDVGVGTYTRQTFSDERYNIWTMQSQYHNTPTINGYQQLPGEQYRAGSLIFNTNDKIVEFKADISSAYPKEAMIKSWSRNLRLKRGSSFLIRDAFTLEKRTGETSFNFMTSLMPEKISNGVVILKGEGFSLLLNYDDKKCSIKIEEIILEDSKLMKNWGEKLYRMVFINPTEQLNETIQFEVSISKAM